MDNKSEILEQKKQSETALASARANAEQRWKRGNQSERISSRVISVRFIRVPLSFSPKNRAQRAGWLLRISPFLYGCMFLSPLFVLLPFAYKKSTKNRAKKEKKSIRKPIRLTLTRSDSLRTNAGSHGNLRRFLQRNLRRNGSAGWKLNSRHWNLCAVCA